MILYGPCKRCGRGCSVYNADYTANTNLCSTCEYYKMTGYNPDAIEPRWLRFLRWLMS